MNETGSPEEKGPTSSLRKLWSVYASPQGSIGRFAFFKRSVYLGIFAWLLLMIPLVLMSQANAGVHLLGQGMFGCVVLGWLSCMVTLVIRRLHDLGLSGWHAVWVIGAQFAWDAISYGPPWLFAAGLPLFAVVLWIAFWPGKISRGFTEQAAA